VYRFRDIASYLSKVADVHLPHLHLEPALGVTQFKFYREIWHQKN